MGVTKLTKADVEQIKEMYNSGSRICDISRVFNVYPHAVL